MRTSTGIRLGLALLALYAAAVGLGILIAKTETGEARAEALALPSPEMAKVAALGFNHLLADLYFIQSLQYYGRDANKQLNFRDLAPLIELVSELDPKFKEPLMWAGIALPRNLGRETWLNTAESTRVLKKAVERFPGDFRGHLFLAYNLTYFHRNYDAAAKQLEKAVGLPGAPPWIPALITRLYSTAGDLSAATALAEAVAGETQDPELKRLMEERVLDVETERRLRQLDEGIKDFHARFGRWPTEVLQLLTSGAVRALAPEPRGGYWLIDPKLHEARSSQMHGRLRVYEHSRGAPRNPDKPN